MHTTRQTYVHHDNCLILVIYPDNNCKPVTWFNFREGPKYGKQSYSTNWKRIWHMSYCSLVAGAAPRYLDSVCLKWKILQLPYVEVLYKLSVRFFLAEHVPKYSLEDQVYCMHRGTFHIRQASGSSLVHHAQVSNYLEREFIFALVAKATALHFVDSRK